MVDMNYFHFCKMHYAVSQFARLPVVAYNSASFV